MIEIYDLSEEDSTPFCEFMTSEVQAMLNTDSCSAVGISEDGTPVGAVVANIKNSDAAGIVSLFVKEDRRRRGYGTELIYRVLTLLSRKEDLSCIEADFAVTEGDDNGLYEFFSALDFKLEADDMHGAFMISLAEAAESEIFKKASSHGVTPYSKATLQSKNMIKAAHPMLNSVEIDEKVSCVATAGGEGDSCPDCLLFTKEEDTLVMVWADSSEDKLNLVRMLKFAVEETIKAYGVQTKVRIPYINENSKKLIVKMMGEKAVTAETVWNAALPVFDTGEVEESEAQTQASPKAEKMNIKQRRRKMNYLVRLGKSDLKLFEGFLSAETRESVLEDDTLSVIGFCSGDTACGAAVLRFMPEESELYWLNMAPEVRNGSDDHSFFTKLLTLLCREGNDSVSVLLPVGENVWAQDLFKVFGITYEDSGTGVIHTTLERFLGGGFAPKKPSKNCKALTDVTDKELSYICGAAIKAGVDYVKLPINRADYSGTLSAVSYEDGKPVGIMLIEQTAEDLLTVSYLYTTTPNPSAVLELIRYASEAIAAAYPPETRIDIPFVEKKIVEMTETKGNPLSIVRNKRGRISLDYIKSAMERAQAEMETELMLKGQGR